MRSRLAGCWRCTPASGSTNYEIVVSGRRIAYIGPIGSYRGEVARRVKHPHLSAVPGFGEVHKHIESTHITPEFEAALVLPRGNTWTCEASHEFANVNGGKNTEFWQKARLAGSPLKVFIQPGSAVPPSAWEESGGYYGYEEQKRFLADDLSVTSLDEVMDWPSVWDPTNPGYARMWGMIRATFEMRGVVEGHGSGLTDPHDISAFIAAGLSSDHEVWALDEAWDRLQRGFFVELRPFSYDAIIPGLIERGLEDWSNIAFTTDDRSGIRDARARRLGPQRASRDPLRARAGDRDPVRDDQSRAAHADRSSRRLGRARPLRRSRAARGRAVAEDRPRLRRRPACLRGQRPSPVPCPASTGRTGRRKTMNIGRTLSAGDFAIPAEPGRATMQAAVLRPFHWNEDFLTVELPVADGAVQRTDDTTKWALIDRYRGDGAVASMFWTGSGPDDPDTALCSSVAHDSHNVWCIGSSDAAMAMAVNRLQEIDGGWVLVHRGEVTAEMRFEIGGLMTARTAEEFDRDWQTFLAAAAKVTWRYKPSALNLWKPGFPEFLKFATLTCSPWRWVLVAPSKLAPNGFVNVQTGETHPVVW